MSDCVSELRVSGQFGMVLSGDQNTERGGPAVLSSAHSQAGSACHEHGAARGGGRGGAARDEARPGDTPRPAPATPDTRTRALVVRVAHPVTQSLLNLPLDLSPGHHSSVRAVKVTGPCQSRHCQGCHITQSTPSRLSLAADPFSVVSVLSDPCWTVPVPRHGYRAGVAPARRNTRSPLSISHSRVSVWFSDQA